MDQFMPYLDKVYRVVYNSRYGILYSLGFFMIGFVLFSLLTYLASIPGNKKIDNRFMNETDKQKQLIEKKKVKTIYLIALFAMSVIIFVVTESV